jgi:hypothetical protein
VTAAAKPPRRVHAIEALLAIVCLVVIPFLVVVGLVLYAYGPPR